MNQTEQNPETFEKYIGAKVNLELVDSVKTPENTDFFILLEVNENEEGIDHIIEIPYIGCSEVIYRTAEGTETGPLSEDTIDYSGVLFLNKDSEIVDIHFLMNMDEDECSDEEGHCGCCCCSEEEELDEEETDEIDEEDYDDDDLLEDDIDDLPEPLAEYVAKQLDKILVG